VRERYAYTADGRLAAVWGPPGPAAPLTLSYDGPHMVAATTGGNLAWQARWGPGLDRLVEWTDNTGGTGTVLTLTDESRWDCCIERLAEPAAANSSVGEVTTPQGAQCVCLATEPNDRRRKT